MFGKCPNCGSWRIKYFLKLEIHKCRSCRFIWKETYGLDIPKHTIYYDYLSKQLKKDSGIKFILGELQSGILVSNHHKRFITFKYLVAHHELNQQYVLLYYNDILEDHANYINKFTDYSFEVFQAKLKDKELCNYKHYVKRSSIDPNGDLILDNDWMITEIEEHH